MEVVNGSRQVKPTGFNPKFLLLVSVFNVICGTLTAVSLWALGVQFAGMFAGLPPNQQISAQLDHLFRLPWLSFLLGILIGLPESLWRKRRLRVQRQETLQQMLQPRNAGLDWSRAKSALLEILPIMAAHIAAIGFAYLLRLAIYPAMFGPGVSMFLWYPEYKALYEEAHRQLMARNDSDSPWGSAN